MGIYSFHKIPKGGGGSFWATSLVGILWLLISPITQAALIAEQNFDALTVVGGTINQRLGSGSPLLSQGAYYGGGDLGLGFDTYWFRGPGGDSRGPSNLPGDYDVIGVNDRSAYSHYSMKLPEKSPSGDPVETGVEQNFLLNDPDGRLSVIFHPVDVSHYKDVTVSLKFWINGVFDTPPYWEGDRFGLYISDGITTESIFDLEATDIIPYTSAPGSSSVWHTISWVMKESALTGPNLQLTVFMEGRGEWDSITIDDVRFEGTHLPEPGSATLFLLALIFFGSRRTRWGW